MKNFLLSLMVFFAAMPQLQANGVCIVNAEEAQYLRLLSSEVEVEVYNQIAVTVVTQQFKNEIGVEVMFKYGFPMPDGGSATGLRWFTNGQWHEADFSAEPQDTILPGPGGGGNNPSLSTFLGSTPLFLDFENALAADSLITIELTYVELLPYKFGVVTYRFPNNYTAIQSNPLTEQRFNLLLSSGRVIEALTMTSHPSEAAVSFTNFEGVISLAIYEQIAGSNYQFQYTLSSNDLGLVGFSNYFPETLSCDTHGQGFCAFIAEPDGSASAPIINKVFTLIIDRSGSMSGYKMVQARNAATFIVQNMNEGDRFNIIDFDDIVTGLFTSHQYYTPATLASALSYINTLFARGATNISGAFQMAIPQFNAASSDTYNVIIFLTDGAATAGITSTTGILDVVNELVITSETDISIFSFGIGNSVNEQLLTLLANQNNGIATFLKNDELELVISDFYLTIQNPVLLNTEMSVSPNLVTEIYSIPLPNLFKGIQMLVVGRYNTPGEVNVNLSGNAFGNAVSYDYPLSLTETNSLQMQFLPKLWAKQKIAYLTQQYYAAPNSTVANLIMEQIIDISTCYRVISAFTSFSDNTGGTVSVYEENMFEPTSGNSALSIAHIYPNPAATGNVVITFTCNQPISETVTLNIYNVMGQLVATYPVSVSGTGSYSFSWNTQNAEGKNVSNGYYYAVLSSSVGSATGKIFICNK